MNPRVAAYPLCFGLGLAVLLSPALFAQKAGPTPVYVDVARSIRKQRDAADAAVEDARRGAADAAKTLAHLSDVSGLVRDRVYRTILEKWSTEDLAALAPGLGTAADPLTREAVAEIYGERTFRAGVPALVDALTRSKDEESRVLCLWALGRIVDPQTVKTIEAVFKREKGSFRVKAEALRTLHRVDPRLARARIDEAAKGDSPPLRIEAIELLSECDVSAFGLAAALILSELPKDPRNEWAPRVWLAAADLVQKVRWDAASRTAAVAVVDALIAVAEGASGRLQSELYAALPKVTGNSLPADALTWRLWWEKNREAWQPLVEGAPPPPTPRTGAVRYHGEFVDSSRLAFLVDLSGGMGRTLVEGDGGATRLDLAKQELARVLGELPEDYLVSVAYFGSFFERFSEAPVLLKGGRARLLEFNASREISKKPGHNRGNLYDTLIAALTQPFTDTVYLLSEGAPTEGKFQDPGRFIANFQRWNRHYRVRVCTVFVGEPSGRARDLLKQLSDGTGGSFRELGGKSADSR
ncbi:MAG: HEAT repeat domain-containing protein [Planctomycetota bacterium]